MFCPDCHEIHDDSLTTCPHCGREHPRSVPVGPLPERLKAFFQDVNVDHDTVRSELLQETLVTPESFSQALPVLLQAEGDDASWMGHEAARLDEEGDHLIPLLNLLRATNADFVVHYIKAWVLLNRPPRGVVQKFVEGLAETHPETHQKIMHRLKGHYDWAGTVLTGIRTGAMDVRLLDRMTLPTHLTLSDVLLLLQVVLQAPTKSRFKKAITALRQMAFLPDWEEVF